MLNVCVDFESTGLLKPGRSWHEQPKIVEIGAVKFDEKFNVVGEYRTLINPDIDFGRWEPEAIEVTGIGPEQVVNCPSFFLAFHDFAEFMTGAKRWVGYNNPFDKSLLKYELERAGLETCFPWPMLEIDVMIAAASRMAMSSKSGNKNPQLGEAYRHFTGKELVGAHGALTDVKGTIEVMRYVV